jgi:predicted methyltransferase
MGRELLVKVSLLSVIVSIFLVNSCAMQTSQDYRSILTNAARPDAERALDAERKPDVMLQFYGVKAGDKVADLLAARGYYTAILSQAVGPQGMVYSANPAPRPEWSDRFSKPEFANVKLLTGGLDQVALPQDGSLDFVLIHLDYHELAPEVRIPMNKKILGSLKRGGMYGVIDHSAKEGSGNEATKTLHRIDKVLVIKEVTGVGFALAKEGDMFRRPDDTRDFSVTKERGKDDRFALAFQRP